ncbi:MAG TPA: class III extradiol dioxygenase subunit B-like domain-containing protein [Mycobacteriales bacterium]
MLVAAGFCPHPPLLVPQVASGAAGELDQLRDLCDEVVTSLVRAGPDLVLVLGGGERAARWSDGDGGSLAGFGLDVLVPLRGPVRPGRDRMPLSLTVGAWLLGRSNHSGERLGFSVPDDADDEDLAAWAGQIDDLADRLAVLVMGDGSARRTEHSPGYLDERAVPFDKQVAAGMAAGDPSALRCLDPTLGTALLAAGTAPWRLAGWLGGDERFDAEVLYHDAPYGVGYLVARWRRG